VSVRRHDDGTIILEGNCPVEDAEPLLRLLEATPAAPVYWTGCNHLHTAVLQVILVARPALPGPCGDPWIHRWMAGNAL
jgi:hypothetical protein